MAWKTQCTEFFSQYMELLEDLTHFLDELKETVITLEQCVDFKENEELECWRNRAEVGFCSDLKYLYFDRYILINNDF